MANSLSPELRYNRGRCRTCNKWAYPSRKAARHTIRTAHPGDDLDIYPCPADRTIWHIGHGEPRR